MIFRQDLERLLANFTRQREEALGRLQHAEGLLDAANRNFEKHPHNKAANETFVKAQKRVIETRDSLLIASGAEQTVTYMIREIDLEEVEPVLKNPISIIRA